jgi:2'-hydroxyisoflavone reductase
VRQSAELLADKVARYCFISSISVYRDPAAPGLREDAALAVIEDETTEAITTTTYGPLKALCERAAEEAMPARVLTIRPGLIVGPFDPSDRFTYWPARVARGGEILAPGRPEREVQFIDARDLAEWILRMIEQQRTGVYNATGPQQPLTMLGFLEACRSVCGSGARFVWADEDFLIEQKIEPYTQMPLWIPAAHDTVDCGAAQEAGLMYRLLEETIQDTLAWDATRPPDRRLQAGLDPAREKELLALQMQEQ